VTAPLEDPVDDVGFLPKRRSLLLSASMPQQLDPVDYVHEDRRQVQEINERYVATAQPERIRAAIIAITRIALNRGVRLVFGAHPTISPLVLQVAQGLGGNQDDILVFQSNAYRHLIPQSTLDLADWSRGRLILTSAQLETRPAPTAGQLKRLNPYPNSLFFMRKTMAEVPGLIGAAFVGGARGVLDESVRFSIAHPTLRRYAYSSTGGAAAHLWRLPRHAGAFRDPAAFDALRSYTVAASMMFDDLPR
jgi:hypothetical protein